MFLFTTSEASTLEEGVEMEETTTLSGGADGDTGTQVSSSDPDVVDTDYNDDIVGKPPTVEVFNRTTLFSHGFTNCSYVISSLKLSLPASSQAFVILKKMKVF